MRKFRSMTSISCLQEVASTIGSSTRSLMEDEIDFDEWPVTKILSQSDTKSELRVEKVEVEDHILERLTAQQRNILKETNKPIDIEVLDVDKNVKVLMKFKKTSNGKYRLFGFWKNEFVNRRELKKGQAIGLRHNNGKFEFSVIG